MREMTIKQEVLKEIWRFWKKIGKPMSEFNTRQEYEEGLIKFSSQETLQKVGSVIDNKIMLVEDLAIGDNVTHVRVDQILLAFKQLKKELGLK